MKRIGDYTHKELLMLSESELSKLFDIESEIERGKAIKFENEEYPKFSFDEKVKYWSGALHRQMRWQAECGLDPYAIFDINWYNSVKMQEADIDNIMNEVFDKFWSSTGGEWSKQEYLKRINKSLT